MASTFAWAKGHGTENDYIVLPDYDGGVHGDLSKELVTTLCHRRRGLGADGVLRVVRSSSIHGVPETDAEWFMDYRNPDGSVAQMCGNGARVFVRFLAESGLVDPTGPIRFGTRSGTKTATIAEDGSICVDMGTVELQGSVEIAVGDRSWKAHKISVGNPHAVVFVDSLEEAGPLQETPEYDVSDFPDGVNVEFVRPEADGELSMRVYERGAGETRSCGTGACAAAVAHVVTEDLVTPTTIRVGVLGGTLEVPVDTGNEVKLSGPAVIVAQGELELRLAG
ncbi:MAG: diaminopimelate epimerase [Propionibacteriales bacterium]|nr:diaminopimelate epimerase [Propionibacteriales bacterium]